MKKKRFIPILGMILIIFLILAYLTRGLDDIKALEVENISIFDLENGYYEGSFEKGRWSNKLSVYIENGEIKSIEIIEDVFVRDERVTNELFSQIIEKQSLEVDLISNATVTSKAYLKSIEDALNK